MINFSSENYDLTHPEILKALIKANKGFEPSYGKDEFTEKVILKFKDEFKTKDLEVFFCFNGTGANNFALSSITEKHGSVLCSDKAHIYNSESTSPEAFTGCRLYPIKTENGKIIIEDFLQRLKAGRDVHMPPVYALTITQPTEYGTLYSRDELKVIAKYCIEYNILLHIDGARLFNALTAMKLSMAEFAKISGADVITLGGTKSGAMFGEAVIFLNSKRFKNLKYNHKRSMQLASKNRFIAVQFYTLLNKELWRKISAHTNDLAKFLELKLIENKIHTLAFPAETNMVFLKMKENQFRKLQQYAHFYRWDNKSEEVRIAFSFSNTKREAEIFYRKYMQTL